MSFFSLDKNLYCSYNLICDFCADANFCLIMIFFAAVKAHNSIGIEKNGAEGRFCKKGNVIMSKSALLSPDVSVAFAARLSAIKDCDFGSAASLSLFAFPSEINIFR